MINKGILKKHALSSVVSTVSNKGILNGAMPSAGTAMNRYESRIHAYETSTRRNKNGALIRSSDNDSTGLWPPGSLHTLGADGHI